MFLDPSAHDPTVYALNEGGILLEALDVVT